MIGSFLNQFTKLGLKLKVNKIGLIKVTSKMLITIIVNTSLFIIPNLRASSTIIRATSPRVDIPKPDLHSLRF